MLLCRAVAVRLEKFGQATIDALGKESVATAFRSVKKANDNFSKMLEPVRAGVAFSVEIVNDDEKDKKFFRFHVRVIDKSSVGSVEQNDVFLAPKAEENMGGFAGAVKGAVLEKGCAKMKGIGVESVNRLIKTVARMNRYLAEDVSTEKRPDSIAIWAFPGIMDPEESGSDKKLAASFVELAAGPAL